MRPVPQGVADLLSTGACRGERRIVYIPANVASDLGIDVNDPVFQEEFLVTLRALDDAASKGGPTLAGADRRFYSTAKRYV